MGAKVEVFREQFRQVFTSRDNEVARVVELVVLGKKVNGRCMWGADNVIGSDGRDIRGGDEVMDNGGHSLLVVRHRVGRQRAIEVGFFEVGRGFSFVEVCTAHQFYDDVFAMSETSNGRQGDVKILGTPVKVEPVDNILADACKMINCLEVARSWCPVGWSVAQGGEAVIFIRCRCSVVEWCTML